MIQLAPKMKKCLLIVFMTSLSTLNAQDSTFVKTVYAGSSLEVPNGKIWMVESAFINSGDGYNIKVSTYNFKEAYTQNKRIIAPMFVTEMELLSNKNAIWFQLYIKQTNKK